MHVGQGLWVSAPSAQFCCEPKVALKTSLLRNENSCRQEEPNTRMVLKEWIRWERTGEQALGRAVPGRQQLKDDGLVPSHCQVGCPLQMLQWPCPQGCFPQP